MFQSILELDSSISLFFRGLVTLESSLVPLVRFFSDAPILIVAGLLIGIWMWWVYKKQVGLKIVALDILYTILFAFAVYWILQFGLPMRPRPETLTAIKPLIDHLPDNSFPSGHAIFAGASVVAIGYFLSMSLSTVFAILGIAMVIARVIAWVHYFGDVLIGVIVGALLARVAIEAREKIGIKTPLHTYPLKIASFIKL
jgi:membrane-associated phospholipid phosphatase